MRFINASLASLTVHVARTGLLMLMWSSSAAIASDPFRQLDEIWPTPTAERAATGEPGPAYWQQRADYRIDVRLDEETRRIEGSQDIHYQNASPHTLRWLWLQLDQNRFRRDSIDHRTRTMGNQDRIGFWRLQLEQYMQDFEGGVDLGAISDARGRPLDHAVVGTLLRIDLPEPLAPGQSVRFSIDWSYNIPHADSLWARAGYEHFPEDGNDIFLIAQWYPRMVAFTDYEGWHNKEFLGDGEFTLEFGDYEVAITAPSDHVVASTGELQNPTEVLTAVQQERLASARDAEAPVFVVTPEEALANEADRAEAEQTWVFHAENVRDFAWASSRKFIWDAQGHHQPGAEHPVVMAQSFYPREGEPLWSRYSTQAVIHTMEVYSRFSFPYPYPVALSVNGPVGGMEYPMITFNGPRTDPHEDGDRTYSRGEKQFLIGVVIHEIGHIYFPMTVNSDERQWTWMDEGINTFLQYVAEQEWEDDFPSDSGDPRWIVDYMVSENQVPIMTQSDSILQFGNNAYAKPATALVILRETILGRDRFDFAFREYARRWQFRRPTPYDFFRTMEEASGTDLDWFWRGWFYSTDHVDISLDRISRLHLDSADPDVERPWDADQHAAEPVSMTRINNAADGVVHRVDRVAGLLDLYNERDEFTVTDKDRNEFDAFLEGLTDETASDPDWKRRVYERAVADGSNYYIFEFSNPGGLVMPIILELHWENGEIEELHIPAEVWRRSPDSLRTLLVRGPEHVLDSAIVDPRWETADADVENNHYPRRIIPSRLERFERDHRSRNLMSDLRVERDHEEDTGEAPEDEASAADAEE